MKRPSVFSKLGSVTPAALLLGASIVSGAAGYVVTIAAGAYLGPAAYASFAVFWSSLYFAIGALGGVQQEVARATAHTANRLDPLRPARIMVFTAGVMILASLVWAVAIAVDELISRDGSSTGLTLAIGSISYIAIASLCGALYGSRRWMPLATLIAIDGVVRLCLILAVIAMQGDVAAFSWAVIAPFPIAFVLVVPFVARRLIAETRSDSGYVSLAWNTIRTILAAAATASIVSGFPALLSATTSDVPASAIGPIVLALTLVRAPIVIPLLAMQSYLVILFSGRPATGRLVTLMTASVISCAVLLGVLTYFLGPSVLLNVFGEDFGVSPTLLFVIVASSGLVAALCVTGPAVLARSRHSHYVIGWGLAAATTLGLLFLPVDLMGRISAALVIGPVAGLVVHAFGLRLRRS